MESRCYQQVEPRARANLSSGKLPSNNIQLLCVLVELSHGQLDDGFYIRAIIQATWIKCQFESQEDAAEALSMASIVVKYVVDHLRRKTGKAHTTIPPV